MVQYKQPLAEVFGFSISDVSTRAQRYRLRRLCPFNNRVPNCTKDKAENPLGVCSIYHEQRPVITCPVRFRQDWIIADDAASFFFQKSTQWSSLTEVRLNDAKGKSAGNIDVVLVAYDRAGKVIDFGALEIQAVYISGNVREPFEHYMKNFQNEGDMNWTMAPNYPRPDFLSSSRKRLVPQLLYKGGILHEWGKKIAVALDKNFFATLPQMEHVSKQEADISWLIYDLKKHETEEHDFCSYSLTKVDEVYTQFEPALFSITTPSPGKVLDFMRLLQEKLDEQLETPPINNDIAKPF